LLEYILLASSSLFVIVDPLAVVPAFLAMTPNDTAEQRVRTARLACCVTAGVLLLFSVAGQLVFKVMGITMPAFQIISGMRPVTHPVNHASFNRPGRYIAGLCR
jgi:multiple antibiotic resistance protein